MLDTRNSPSRIDLKNSLAIAVNVLLFQGQCQPRHEIRWISRASKFPGLRTTFKLNSRTTSERGITNEMQASETRFKRENVVITLILSRTKRTLQRFSFYLGIGISTLVVQRSREE